MSDTNSCPECGEEILEVAIKCRYCGVALDAKAIEAEREEVAWELKERASRWPVLVGVVLAAGACLCVAIPNLIKARKVRGEAPAIGALKTIGTAQSLFREGPKRTEGYLDYGTLSELGTAGLIDSVLASGTKNGYLFEATYGAMTSEFIWFATARPVTPGTTGDRYFCTNHEGVIFYTNAAPFRLNNMDCSIPAGAQPVGR